MTVLMNVINPKTTWVSAYEWFLYRLKSDVCMLWKGDEKMEKKKVNFVAMGGGWKPKLKRFLAYNQ